jgi:hypothetical protein
MNEGRLHPQACFACQCLSFQGDRAFLAGIAFALHACGEHLARGSAGFTGVRVDSVVARLCPKHRTALLQGHFTSPVNPFEIETPYQEHRVTPLPKEEGPTPSARIRLRAVPTLAPPSK